MWYFEFRWRHRATEPAAATAREMIFTWATTKCAHSFTFHKSENFSSQIPLECLDSCDVCWYPPFRVVQCLTHKMYFILARSPPPPTIESESVMRASLHWFWCARFDGISLWQPHKCKQPKRKLNFASFTCKHTDAYSFSFHPQKSTHNNSLPANNCYLFLSFLFIEYTIVLFTLAFALKYSYESNLGASKEIQSIQTEAIPKSNSFEASFFPLSLSFALCVFLSFSFSFYDYPCSACHPHPPPPNIRRIRPSTYIYILFSIATFIFFCNKKLFQRLRKPKLTFALLSFAFYLRETMCTINI